MTVHVYAIEKARELADLLENYRDIIRASAPLLPYATPEQQTTFRESLELLRASVPSLKRALRAAELSERMLAKAFKKKVWRGVRT